MEKMAYTLIIIGALLWVFSIFFMEARWQPQMLSALIMIVGIISAHVWEELFQSKEE